MKPDNLEIQGGVTEISNGIQNKVKRVGVKGLNVEQAQEQGVFDRMANILCAMHSTISAAYHVFGHFDVMLDEIRASKHEIKREMNLFYQAYDRFFSFWTSYYAKHTQGNEVNLQAEELYHIIMKWAELPEEWHLGDKQRIEDDENTAFYVDVNGRNLKFSKTVVDTELLAETKESWCVVRFNDVNDKQTTVNTDMDKSSALMVAKRLSSEEQDVIFTAAMVREIQEKRFLLIPYKAFRNNQTIGKIN